MQTHSQIVRNAGTAEQVAQARGVSIHTVRSWILRNSIPSEHWPAFVKQGVATFEELALTAPPRRAPATQARATA